MIGGRALGLQQGPHGDIVNAVRPTADDEGDSDNHEAYGRKTDQQHSRAHDRGGPKRSQADPAADDPFGQRRADQRSEEHTSELQSLMRISYAVFCLKKKTTNKHATIA